jgi:glycosyltransferase involved in cell wall biosynthesis
LANPDDPHSFITHGLELVKNDFDLEQLKINARETTLDISWNKITKNLEDNYQDLLVNSHAEDALPSSMNLSEMLIKQ